MDTTTNDTIEQQYLKLIEHIAASGTLQENRTNVPTRVVFSRTLRHDMADGFPLLTTKRVAWKTVQVELEGFIKGITSKQWFKDRGCNIWNEWCNPQKISYGQDPWTVQAMANEDDLGLIYGAQWRDFKDPNNEAGSGVDQLKNIVTTLKTNPNSRRMVCMAWNPLALDHQALPPCHLGFLVNVIGDRLNLVWWQRSADMFLGVPFNIASYAMLLTLLANEAGLKPGELVGHFEDCHIYENHLTQVKQQCERAPRQFPTVAIDPSVSIFDWDHTKTALTGYDPHPRIPAPIAV